ncbi:retrovirus-related Pol polyprotein from transposon 297 [Trichonephila clavipes]|nr:retrovirus-related Pol polyprotein from transposon 297 [Trichonephila clavipes]
MPIVSKYPNEIVTLDSLGPYPVSRPERYKFILVISDHFTKWSRYGAPISLISDNGPQFISDVFEHLSHRLDIKHMKTVTYRPQANLTERVNRNLVQMISSFVEENHENWDQFLHEFAFALRTAVNETTNKTPAELFLGREIITPFSKLINVTEDTKYVGRDHCKGQSTRTGKKLAPEQRQGVKRSIPSSISSRTYKFKRPNTSSQGVESIAGPSRLPDCRLNKSTTVESWTEGSGRDNKTRQTRATTRGRNKQAERPVRSYQASTRRPCPYYLRSRVKESNGIPEEQRNIEINGIPHSRIRRRSLSMEALDGDPVHRRI